MNDKYKDLTKFSKIIETEELWNCFQIKAVLLKNVKDKVWILGTMHIVLRNELSSEERCQSVETVKSKDIEIMLIDCLYPLSRLSNFIKEIILNKVIIQNQKISLTLFIDSFKYDFKTRAYCNSTYGVNYACYSLINVGQHDNNVINLRKIDLIIYKEKVYDNLRDLCIDELGLEFGTYSIMPHILFLAPINIFIEHSSIENNILKIFLSGDYENTNKNIMLSIRGQDSHGHNTKLNKVIQQFDSFGKFEFKLDDKSAYVKINLYYKNQLSEEFILRNIQQVEVIASTQLEKDSEPVTLEIIKEITKRKEIIKEKFQEAKSQSDINLKGLFLEQVISEIFLLVPNLHIVGSRVNDGIEEIDIQVRNFNRENVWYDMDGIIFIECKNWSKKVGSDEIGNFMSKLVDNGLKTGIFVSINGFTGDKDSGARGKLKRALNQGLKILTIDGNDIDDILNCKEVSKKIDEKYIKMYQ